MKRFWLAAGSLAGVFLVLMVVLWLRFDTGQAKVFLTQSLRNSLNLDARLGYIRLIWAGRPELRIHGLILRHPDGGDLVLEAKGARLTLDTAELWRPRYQVREILLQTGRIRADAVRKSILKDWLSEDSSVRRVVLREITLFDFPGLSSPIEIDRAEFMIREQAIEMVMAGEWKDQDFQFYGIYQPSLEKLRLKLTLGNKAVGLRGDVETSESAAHFSGEIEMHRLQVADWWPVLLTGKRPFEGVLTLQAQLSFSGSKIEEFRQTLHLQGVADMRKGRFSNINPLHQMLQSRSDVPEVDLLLVSDLPEDIARPLRGTGLEFDILKLEFEVKEGLWKLQNIHMQHPDYLLEGEGQGGWREGIQGRGQGRIVLMPRLSDFLKARVEVTDFQWSPQGRLIQPIEWQMRRDDNNGPYLEFQAEPAINSIKET